MPKIILIEQNGTRHEVQAFSEQSVMAAATSSLVPGIIGECGGALCCATCHVYVDGPWLERLNPPSDEERDMIECAVDPMPNSRLGCQIKITDDLDGLVLRLPASQK